MKPLVLMMFLAIFLACCANNGQSYRRPPYGSDAWECHKIEMSGGLAARGPGSLPGCDGY